VNMGAATLDLVYVGLGGFIAAENDAGGNIV
jgi:hypothetical protein